MLSKIKVKFIKSLQLKKNREESGRFVVEGQKSVLELIASSFQIETVLCTDEFLRENRKSLQSKKMFMMLFLVNYRLLLLFLPYLWIQEET